MVFMGGSQSAGESPGERWRREWRRNGGGLMGATFLVGGTWVTSSQTFVATHNGRLVHPSPYGWLFWLCMAGMAFGFYMWISTYVDHLPMFGRRSAQNAEHTWMWQRTRAHLNAPNPALPVQVEIVGGPERKIPFMAPESYEVAQFRQALAKFREAGIIELDPLTTLTNMLLVMRRHGKDSTYEPLRVYRDSKGLAALIASGELVKVDDRRYRLPCEGP